MAATPVASVVKLAADLRLERSASGVTVRFPHPVGLSAKEKIWSGVRESNPPHLLGRHRPKATGPTPLTLRALCLALRLPVSMRRIVACAGLWAGFSGGLRALDPSLSLPFCPRPCAGGKTDQSSIVVTRGSNCPSNERGDGLWQPIATHVSSGFLIAVIMAARFLRLLTSEVKRHINIPRAT